MRRDSPEKREKREIKPDSAEEATGTKRMRTKTGEINQSDRNTEYGITASAMLNFQVFCSLLDN